MASDSFTNTNNTALGSHTVQNTWAKARGNADSEVYIYGNLLRVAAYRENHYWYSESTVDSSQVVVKPNASNSIKAGPAVRIQGGGVGGYHANLGNHSGGYATRISIEKNASWLGGAPVSADNTVDHTIKITASGTGATVTIKVYLDGELVKTLDDSSSPYTSGNSGVFLSNATTPAIDMLDDWTDGVAVGVKPYVIYAQQ